MFFTLLASVIALVLATAAALRIRRALYARRGLGMVIASITVAAATLVGGVAFDALVGSSPSNNVNQPVYGAQAPAAGSVTGSLVK